MRIKALGVALLSSTLCSLGHAQVLEEVLVTAQKRTESLQEVPISVSTLQGDRIDAAGIGDLSALSNYVPNLYISNASITTRVYLRGAGSGDNQAFEQSVGMYIDGIYMSRGRQYKSPFMDLERVEVLRGPQGTLFGRNTVAGAISISTANPDFEEAFNGKVSASVESHKGRIGELMFSGAVSDALAMRLAYKYTESDGYVDNALLDETEGQRQEHVMRYTALWDASDTVTLNFKYSYADFSQIGSPSLTSRYLSLEERTAEVPNRDIFSNIVYALVDQDYPALSDAASRDFTTFKNNNRGLNSSINLLGRNPDGSDTEINNLALNATADIADFELTSISGYSGYDYKDGVDADFLPITFIQRDDDQEFQQFSQEFRISSPSDNAFNYIVGVYFDKSNLKFDRRVSIDTSIGGLLQDSFGAADLLSLITAGAYSANQTARNHYYELDTVSYAGFGQANFDITDSVSLSLGLRYTRESKEVQSRQFLSDSNAGLGVASINPTLVAIQGAVFNSYIYDLKEQRSTAKWLPSLNAQWHVGDDTMLYFSATKGFKSGGFTSSDDGPPGHENGDPRLALDPTRPSDDFEFDDESVRSYEVGGKSTLLEGGMTANWALFYTQYSNLQISSFRDVGYVITNASESVIKGLELDVEWQLSESLLLGGSAAYLDAEYTDYRDAPCTAAQLDVDLLCGQTVGSTYNDLSGKSTLFAPTFTASIHLDYARELESGLSIYFGADVNYRADYETAGDLDPSDRADAYTKLNIHLGLRGRADRWQVQLYGRNIGDEQSKSIGFDTPALTGSHTSYVDEAAVFGLRTQLRF